METREIIQIWKGMPDRISVTRVDNSRRVAIQMKNNKPANVEETKARIKVSDKANREIANAMKVVSKKAEPREAVRTAKS